MHIEGKELMGVDKLIGLSDRYELALCKACSDGYCLECTKDKSVLTVAGEQVKGTCQCGHSRLRPHKPCEMCEGFGKFEVTKEMAIDAGLNPEDAPQIVTCGGCNGKGYTIQEATDVSQE